MIRDGDCERGGKNMYGAISNSGTHMKYTIPYTEGESPNEVCSQYFEKRISGKLSELAKLCKQDLSPKNLPEDAKNLAADILPVEGSDYRGSYIPFLGEDTVLFEVSPHEREVREPWALLTYAGLAWNVWEIHPPDPLQLTVMRKLPWESFDSEETDNKNLLVLVRTKCMKDIDNYVKQRADNLQKEDVKDLKLTELLTVFNLFYGKLMNDPTLLPAKELLRWSTASVFPRNFSLLHQSMYGDSKDNNYMGLVSDSNLVSMYPIRLYVPAHIKLAQRRVIKKFCELANNNVALSGVFNG